MPVFSRDWSYEMVSWNQDNHFGRKWIPCFVTALFFAGSFAYEAFAEDTPVRESMLAIPRLEKVPDLDGRFKPGEWAYAAQVTGFLTIADQLAQLQTTVRAGYDADNLYFAFASHCPSPIRKGITEHDGPVTRDDAFEIYLQPDTSTERYYFFAGNALGTRQDARCDAGKIQFDWNADWVTANHVEYDAFFVASTWTTEIAIPFAALGIEKAPARGTRWAVNFARDWSADQLPHEADFSERSTSWVRTGGNFHIPERFASLIFDEKAPGVQIASLGDLTSGRIGIEGSVASREETVLNFNWTIAAQNEPAREISSGSEEIYIRGTASEGLHFLLEDKLDLETSTALPLVLTFSAADVDGNVLLRTLTRYEAVPAFRAEVFPVFLKDKVWIELDIRHLPDVSAETKGQVEITNAEGNLAVKEVVDNLGVIKSASVSLDISKLKPGEYVVHTSLLDAHDSITAASSHSLLIPPKPVWFNNKLGISDKVPPPWMDMVTEGRNIRVGERTYRLGEMLLPESIHINGVEFLAGAVRLNFCDSNGENTLAKTKWQLDRAKATEALYHFDCQSETADIRGSLQAEYDGLLLYEVTVTPRSGIALISSLNIEIPLHREMSPFLRADRAPATKWADEPGQTALIGEIKDPRPDAVNMMTSYFGYSPGGWTWGSEFIPQFWVGDDVRGLFCFLESDEFMNWEGQPLEVIHEGPVTVLRINFISQEMQLDRPLRYTFAFQATPVRERNRRLEQCLMSEARPEYIFDAYGARPGRIHGMVNHFLGRNNGSTYDYIVGDPKTFKERIAFYKTIGAEYLIINGASFFLAEEPEYQLYGAEWESLPGIRYPNYGDSGFTGVNVCPRTSFVDYYLWWLKQLIEEYDIGGIYLDMTGATGCNNKYHGCGYEKNGRRHTTADLFPFRTFYKRFYTLLKEEGQKRGREFYVQQHSSIYANIPFVDHVFKGEGWAVTDGALWDHLTPTYFRAFENQQPIAANYTFYPLISQPKFRHAKQWATPGDLLARTLVHDVLCWATTGFHKEMAPIWNAWEDFGMQDAVWVPYYAGDPRVQTTSKDLLVSFYTKRDRTMVVVSNLTANKIRATLKLDREGLGLPSGTLPAQDVLGGQTTVQGPITADTLFAGRRFDDIQDSSDKHRYPPREIPPNQSPVLEGDEFSVEVGPRDLLVLRVN